MKFVWFGLGMVGLAVVLALLVAYICFYRIFYCPERKKVRDTDRYPVPSGKEYEPFRDRMYQWIREARELPHRDVSMTSYDGLCLKGRFYEYAPGAPIELLLHGYRGSAERDLSGGVARCFALGHSVLIVDHRASGFSEGHIITFGAKESRDCEAWIQYILTHIDSNAKIILAGVSMGAATILITAAKELPKNVVGVLADCGYTSAEAIIGKVMRDMKLSDRLLLPFARLGARIYGGFRLADAAPIHAMQQCRLPVLFIHGDGDSFVPCDMSRQNFEACTAPKKLVIIPDAAHGLCFPVAPEEYVKEAKAFFDPLTQ
ncbi:MAG: alpha/beta hydrolase [Clostridia bacterium]|nr:alpha/beta hydrolase [Clostridia bacterium]